ncbi:hypothetical protein TERTU_2303 [Teredinibacter turnerae T7901]|uniref:Uncharacterized protein n=1 Tax=Teredinibacter turnerae (strain ATCC 39867 / T7901) TaxID=377629 RepID=C5BK59_TERTT|nr:hypothetical protein TERTU_2303 [Teredinibacter turnerae T7901]
MPKGQCKPLKYWKIHTFTPARQGRAIKKIGSSILSPG